MYPYVYAMFGATCKVGQLVFIYIFGSIGTHLNDDREDKYWDRFDYFLLSFSFFDPKVNN